MVLESVSVRQVKKRDGRLVDFDRHKITTAIFKAAESVGGHDLQLADELSKRVAAQIERNFAGKIASVEDVQDSVEKVLIETDHAKTAKAYILYRAEHSKKREAKMALLGGKLDEESSNLSLNALTVLERRYLIRDKNTGNIIETPTQMWWRIANNIASADALYGADVKKSAATFYRMMHDLEFLPNSPTIMNAGTDMQQLSACFVVPVPDSIEGIFEALKHAAIIHKSGGGTGFDFSRLRPKNDVVKSTMGVSSGPISFMKIFDTMTQQIKQGGKRRGANMGILRIDHPDILEFINLKADGKTLNNFNISVAATNKFMEAVKDDRDYELLNPRSKAVHSRLSARAVFDNVIALAWARGDPGLVFIDRMNEKHACRHIAPIEATNPCVTADTVVQTAEGPRKVSELIHKRFLARVDGRDFNAPQGFFKTGRKKVFCIRTKEGYSLRLTEDHLVAAITSDFMEPAWVKAENLRPGNLIRLNNHRNNAFWPGKGNVEEGYLLGLLLGDGTLKKDKAVISVWEDGKGHSGIMDAALAAALTLPHRSDFQGWVPVKGRKEHRLALGSVKKLALDLGMAPGNKSITQALQACSSSFCRGFLRGLFDTDGSVQGSQRKGVSVRLAQSNLDTLVATQAMLLRLGIVSSIFTNRRIAGFSLLPDGKGGKRRYPTKAQHELVIANNNLFKFAEIIGFSHTGKRNSLDGLLARYVRTPNRECFVCTVQKIVGDGIEDVYDVQVPLINAFDANGMVVHNCGEQPLMPYESCNLGSINLNKCMTHDNKFDWDKFRQLVHDSIHFLDNVVDVNRYPVAEIEHITKGTRKVGLGLMGFADVLFRLGVSYDSEEGLQWGEQIMKFMFEEADKASQQMAEERGCFPFWKGSAHEKAGRKRRNSTILTIAPTGTIGMIAEASGGLEPNFAICYIKNVMDGTELLYANEWFEKLAKARGFYSESLMREIAQKGSIQNIAAIPADVRRVFVTAQDISPEWHIRMQAAFQNHCDSSISKTINFPSNATIDDVRTGFLLAWDLGCKGVTVYRDGSLDNQVMNIAQVNKSADNVALSAVQLAEKYVSVAKKSADEKSLCPECKSRMIFKEGCTSCPGCGFSKCSVS